MRRVLAALLVGALTAAPAAGASLHVHDYAEHDHPEHHHGPASHQHGDRDHASAAGSASHRLSDRHEQSPVRLESCDPAGHAVAVSMSCAPASRLHLTLAEVAAPSALAPTMPLRVAIGFSDVRVHGPPLDAAVPARAPPAIPLA